MPRRYVSPRLRGATRACAVMLLVAAAPVPASATTLVVLVSKRAIVIGADSMRTLAGGGTESVCKIHDYEGIVYGFAGAVSSERFDATSIASRELAGGGDLREKATRIADALQAGLVAHFKTRQIDRTRRELVEGQRGRPVTGFVAALVGGKPVGFLVLVLAEPSADGVVLTTRVEPLDTLGPDRAIFLSSQHQEVIQRANRTMGDRQEASVAELLTAASDLVALDLALEADRAPAQRKSGPPATVAVIDRDGFRFTEPGVCRPAEGSRPRGGER
ncbi:MAG: hypothetical protein ABIT71_18860 [Vicinamibacteraceae bacterium]